MSPQLLAMFNDELVINRKFFILISAKRILERLRQTDPDSAVEDATFVKLILEAVS